MGKASQSEPEQVAFGFVGSESADARQDKETPAPRPPAGQLSLFGARMKSAHHPGEHSLGLRWLEERPGSQNRPPTFEFYQDLVQTARSCTRCGLREGCKQVVVGDGSPHADLMLVGEGPGADEDRLGKPFVGRAGQLLDRILEASGFKRENVYITNTVLCRPPGNRTPTTAEIQTCAVYLNAHIELIQPTILVALGSTAAQVLVGPGTRITRARGTWYEYRGIPVMPTFHPAALLRDPGKKRPVWEDFQALRARFDELGQQTDHTTG